MCEGATFTTPRFAGCEAFVPPENPAQPIGWSWLSRWSGEVTTLGSGTVLTLMSLLVAGYLLSRQENALRPGSLLVSVGGGTLLTYVWKALFGRDRPNAVPELTDALDKSYPSGTFSTTSLGCLFDRGGDSRAHDQRKTRKDLLCERCIGRELSGWIEPCLPRGPLSDRCYRRMGCRDSLGPALLARILLA